MTLPRSLRALAALASISVLGVSLTMCGGGETKKAPVVDGIATLSVSASPDKVPADGTATDVTVLAAQADGTNGQGTVSIQVTNGTLNGAAGATSVDLASGRGTVKWACDAAQKSACKGTQTVTATWAGKTATATVEFTDHATGDAGPVTDAGPVDSGTDAPSDAPVDAPTDAPTDAQADVAVIGTLAIASSKPKVYIGTSDFATLTATVKRQDGGPLANEAVSFTTDNGLLSDAIDGGQATTVGAVTSAAGTAQVILRDNNVVANATVVVTRPATSQTAQTTVAIAGAQTLSYVSTKCGGNPCTIIGVKHSGFNEQASVAFKVLDAQNNPVPGIVVTFDIPSPPTGTTVSASATTDAQGVATAVVNSGPIIGSFIVNATVVAPTGNITTPSPTIGIRGAIPTNKGFNFSCSRVNLNAFDSPTPPNTLSTTCSLKLVDRFNNSVGTGTAVNFKSEAGTLPNSQATTAYVAGGANANEGTASVPFSTVGNFPPEDVAPLGVVAGQYPNDRLLEPSWADGLVTRNPRDGLVSLLAYVQGEEWFSDDNNNGQWDSGEQFVDQGEPLLDTNDNGVFDVGEFYLDVNGNNLWDGPNGLRDATTTVWAETRVLYTDSAYGPNSSIVPASGFTLATGSIQSFTGYFLDINKNYVSKDANVLTLENTSPRTLTALITQNFVDDYGFPIARSLVATGTELACAPATPICKYKVIFTKWPGPTSVLAYVSATLSNPASGTPAGGATSFRMKATSGGGTLTLQSTGVAGP